MKPKTFNIADVYQQTVNNFNTGKIPVVMDIDGQGRTIHTFSQKELVTDIDLAFNSIFKNGKKDKNGKRRMYLNVVRFYWMVACKNTNVKISNYVFTPTDYSTTNLWTVWFYQRQFANFVKDEGYGDVIFDLNGSIRRYGSAVSKKVADTVSVVPIPSIVCDQSAATIMDGIEGGTPFIEQHEYSYKQMSNFPDWTLPSPFKGKRAVQEGYIFMTEDEYMQTNPDVTYDDSAVYDTEEMKLYEVVIMPSGKLETDKRVKYEPLVLFCEETELPYSEYHTMKQHGRWIGMGEIEKQLEGQIAKNANTNLRRRGMDWSTKHIYQKAGDPIGRSLAGDVEDGEVLEVGTNGQMSRIDTSTASLSDFNEDDKAWDDNGQKQSFAFESATGESFSANTPFRLGALVSNSAMEHFDLEKGQFSRALLQSFFQQIIPIFEDRYKKDVAIIASSEEGFEELREVFLEVQTNDAYIKLALHPDLVNMKKIPTKDEVRQIFAGQLNNAKFLFTQIGNKIYKDAKYKVDIDIAGENKPLADRETLTTVYTEMTRKGDPRADRVLDILLASMGKNLAAIAGPIKTVAPVQTTPTANGTPNLQGLAPQTTNAA